MNSIFTFLQSLADGMARRIESHDGQAPSWHLWKTNEIDAITIALAAQRPLLVRGEPGTGKSQLARAAAAALGWAWHGMTLHMRSEPQDLLYQFDAVRRLADAQAQSLGNENAYWQPQALWKALDWDSAHDYGSLRPALGMDKPAAPAGHVVLIDEIDKAPSDVPNGLLEVLGARSFDIPALSKRVTCNVGSEPFSAANTAAWPLVIITTNEERELPAAFVRRCMVLDHAVDEMGDYASFLVMHGRAHFGVNRLGLRDEDARIDDSLLQSAADRLVQDRKVAQSLQLPAPGLAEYLDVLYALHRIAAHDPAKQEAWLTKLNQYAYRKNRIEGNGPSPVRQHAGTVLQPFGAGA